MKTIAAFRFTTARLTGPVEQFDPARLSGFDRTECVYRKTFSWLNPLIGLETNGQIIENFTG